MKKHNKIIILIGAIFLLIGIYMSVFLKEAHFYSIFSIGAFLILLGIYNSISKKSLFDKWKFKKYFLFVSLLAIVLVAIDKIGMYLGYWTYPSYTNLFDEILKYSFEWVLAHGYIMLSFMIGKKIFEKKGFSKYVSIILSLIIFVTAIGFITEYINSFAFSWKVLSMPITNYKIGEYFLIFQTIGYWLMAIIPFGIYKMINKKW